jgi:hypothetical protein
MLKDKYYLLKINFSYDFYNIEQEIITDDFVEPTIESIEDVSTSKQIIFFLHETFGEAAYDFLDQNLIDLIEESEMESICEIIIECIDDEISYSIDINNKTIEIND